MVMNKKQIRDKIDACKNLEDMMKFVIENYDIKEPFTRMKKIQFHNLCPYFFEGLKQK